MNEPQFNRKRPRRYKGKPGLSPGGNTPESSDMDPSTDSTGKLSAEVVQDIAEAVMADAERSAESRDPAETAESAYPGSEADTVPAGDPSGQPARPQGPPSGPRPPRDPQQQQLLAQQRREQDMQRREAERQRREAERQRREQENLRRQADQQRRDAEERARLPIDDLCRKAWEIYLAEVSEEGVELFPDNDARELSRRSFRLAEIFLQEELRARRPVQPPQRDRPARPNGTDREDYPDQQDQPESEAREAPAAESSAPAA